MLRARERRGGKACDFCTRKNRRRALLSSFFFGLREGGFELFLAFAGAIDEVRFFVFREATANGVNVGACAISEGSPEASSARVAVESVGFAGFDHGVLDRRKWSCFDF